MNDKETKLPVPRPEGAVVSGPGAALRERLPRTREDKILFWLRIIGVCTVLLALFAGIAMVMLLVSLRQVNGILGSLESASAELEECSRQLSLALQSLNDQGLQELYAVLEPLQKLDIDSLNTSIESLARIMGPLSRLFG